MLYSVILSRVSVDVGRGNLQRSDQPHPEVAKEGKLATEQRGN